MSKKAAGTTVLQNQGVLSLVPKFYGDEGRRDNSVAKSRGVESGTKILWRKRLQGQQYGKVKGY